jgi:hypothetical protein
MTVSYCFTERFRAIGMDNITTKILADIAEYTGFSGIFRIDRSRLN